jgi:hypothetical protein
MLAQATKCGKLPDHFAVGGEEARLAAWVTSQRRSMKKKRMLPARIEAFRACPFWSWKNLAADVAQAGDAAADVAQAGDAAADAEDLDKVLGPRFRCHCGKTFNCAAQQRQHQAGKKCPLNK